MTIHDSERATEVPVSDRSPEVERWLEEVDQAVQDPDFWDANNLQIQIGGLWHHRTT